MTVNKFILVVLVEVLITVQADIPPDFPRCKNADGACLVKASNEVISKYYSGLPAIGLKPFDPFLIEKFILKRNPSSPIDIEVEFNNLELEGFKTMKVSKFEGLRADLSGRTIFKGSIDHLEFKGHYNIDGKVLILPIKGEGNCRFICKNLHFTYSFDLIPINKQGKRYAALEHVKLEVEPELVIFNFKNLFNGDKALTQTTNEFINANWKEIYHEIEKDITKEISLIIKSLLNDMLEKYPYADIFL